MRVLNISGGRSSGYMLRRHLDENGGELAEDCVAIFCNTGRERVETLDFLHEMETRWGVPLVWLEYHFRSNRKGGAKDPKNHYRIVDRRTASLDSRPFDELIEARRRLPSPLRRFCTSELKIETARRYMKRELGIKSYSSVLGIRYDEPRRWSKMRDSMPDAELPLVRAKATRGDVQAFWAAQDFDLGIPSWMSNCDLCFLKGVSHRVETLRLDPSVGDWWEKQEKKFAVKNGRVLDNSQYAQWHHLWSVRQLRELAGQPSLIDVTEIEDEPGMTGGCFCGD